jgi:Na+/glutamate symporter
MVGLRVAGALWILAGVICLLLLIVVFVGENLENPGILLQNLALPALVAGGAIVSLLIGVRLIARPGPGIVRWSNVAGVAWLIVFGSLVLTRLDEPGPRTSSAMITGFGVAGALVAYLWSLWSRRAGRPD